jgi:hypothetical protein
VIAVDLANPSGATQVHEGPWQHIWHLPGDLILASSDEGITLLPVAPNAEPIELGSFSDQVSPVAVSTDATRILLTSATEKGPNWLIAQLDGSGTEEVPSLSGTQLLGSSPVATWLLFSRADTVGPGSAGEPYLLLDLTSSAVTVPLVQENAAVYTPPIASYDFGRYWLIQAIQPGFGRLWLIDALQGSAEIIGQHHGSVLGSISPGDCYLAISRSHAVGEGRTSQIDVRELQTGKPRVTLDHAVLLGWVVLP